MTNASNDDDGKSEADEEHTFSEESDQGSEDDSSGDEEQSGEEEDENANSPVPPTWVGWSLRIASTLLIVALLGYLGYKAASPTRDFRLSLEAQWDQASTRDGALLVPLELTNDSTQTVRNLRVDLMSDTPEPVQVELLLFGPGETVTYVIPLKERGPVSHRVLSFEQ